MDTTKKPLASTAEEEIYSGAYRIAEGIIMVMNGYKALSTPAPGAFSEFLETLVQQYPGTSVQASEAPQEPEQGPQPAQYPAPEETSGQHFLRVRALVLNEVEDMEWLEAARLLASAMNELAAPHSHSFCVTIRPLVSPECSYKNQ